MKNEVVKFVEDFNSSELEKKITTLCTMIGYDTSDFQRECFKEILKLPENVVLLKCFKEANRLLASKYPDACNNNSNTPSFIKETEKLYRKNIT